jgi:hypothetical protein
MYSFCMGLEQRLTGPEGLRELRLLRANYEGVAASDRVAAAMVQTYDGLIATEERRLRDIRAGYMRIAASFPTDGRRLVGDLGYALQLLQIKPKEAYVNPKAEEPVPGHNSLLATEYRTRAATLLAMGQRGPYTLMLAQANKLEEQQ